MVALLKILEGIQIYLSGKSNSWFYIWILLGHCLAMPPTGPYLRLLFERPGHCIPRDEIQWPKSWIIHVHEKDSVDPDLLADLELHCFRILESCAHGALIRTESVFNPYFSKLTRLSRVHILVYVCVFCKLSMSKKYMFIHFSFEAIFNNSSSVFTKWSCFRHFEWYFTIFISLRICE